jgi:gamma-glutamyltranspeptidase/glutathione hydrolase
MRSNLPNLFFLLAAILLHCPLVSTERLESNHGLVVAGHPEAAQIGASILESGGNTIDAVVATAFALGVAEPYGSGIGGKCAILYYDAASKTTYYIDGLDASGKHFDSDYASKKGSRAFVEGTKGVGIPGMVAALHLAHKKWGSQSWSSLIEPSIELTKKGFEVVEGMPVFFERRVNRIRSNPECASIYLPSDTVPKVGDRIRNIDLGKTMKRIAEYGAEGFYRGELAETIVSYLRKNGSHLTVQDFEEYQARIFPSISIAFEGSTIVSSGRPTSGGAMLLKLLKSLEDHPWAQSSDLRTPEHVSAWADKLRLLYPVIQSNFADTDDFYERWDEVLNLPVVDDMREVAHSGSINDHPWESSFTTHFVVVDTDGNVASVTTSLSHHFGSGVVVPGTGVVLNNSLKNFSFQDDQNVNYVGPNKRPRSTICPTIVFKNEQPVLAIGLPGGGRIPTTLSAALLDILVFDRSPGAAIADTRFHLLRSRSPYPDSNQIQLESHSDDALANALSELGWATEVLEDTEAFGGITALEKKSDSLWVGWADERRSNAAAKAHPNKK